MGVVELLETIGNRTLYKVNIVTKNTKGIVRFMSIRIAMYNVYLDKGLDIII